MLVWIVGLRGNGPRFILRSIDHLAGPEMRSVSVPQLEQVSARMEDSPPDGLQCQFPRCSLAFHVSTNGLSVDAPNYHSVARTFESQSFLFLGVLTLAVSFLLVLTNVALAFALATFALALGAGPLHPRPLVLVDSDLVSTSSQLPEASRIASRFEHSLTSVF